MLLKLIRPYTRIRIPFISQELNIPARDVEALLVSLILDSKVQGHIDQVRRALRPLPARFVSSSLAPRSTFDPLHVGMAETTSMMCVHDWV